MDEIKDDIRHLSTTVSDLAVQMARYNALLEEHIKRTSQLEARVKPIEDHVHLVAAFAKIGLATVSVLAALKNIFHIF